MKKLILISALLLVASNGWAQVSDEIHQRCKDVADYVGCVQISTGSVPTKDNSSEADLKKALKLLPRRLENTSLRDFSSAIQPFTDALALAETDDSIGDSQLVRDSRKIDNALSVARSAWDTSIEASVEMSSSMPMLTTLGRTNSCSVLNREVEAFNASLEGHTMNYPCSSKKTSFNRVIRNENEMISIIRQAALVIADGKALDYPPFISVEDHYAGNYPRTGIMEISYLMNGALLKNNEIIFEEFLKNAPRSVQRKLKRLEIKKTEPFGVLIASIEKNSPADKCGYEEGDVIYGIRNGVVSNLDEFRIRFKSNLITWTIRDSRSFIIDCKL